MSFLVVFCLVLVDFLSTRLTLDFLVVLNSRCYSLAGKGVALLPLSPLRTVRERFHSYGSSLVKAPSDRSRWYNKSYATFTILTCSLLTHCRRMHTLWLKRSFAFPPLRTILQIFSWRETRRKSAPLPVGIMLPCGAIPIRSITERLSLFLTSLTRIPIGFPYGLLSYSVLI
jgi:hypothetical protein